MFRSQTRRQLANLPKPAISFICPIRGVNTIIGTAQIGHHYRRQYSKQLGHGDTSQRNAHDRRKVGDRKTNYSSPTVPNIDWIESGCGSRRQCGQRLQMQNAYTANLIQMTGSSSYVANSLQLTLGSLNVPSDTNIPIPQPTIAPISASLVQN